MKLTSRLLTSIAMGTTLVASLSLSPNVAVAKKVDPGPGSLPSLTSPTARIVDSTLVLSKTVSIDGMVGGQFVVRGWTLVVPAGAFRGLGAITMDVSGTTNQTVDLAISPASLNAFLRPVTLLYHANPNEDVSNESIYWWNPNTMLWEPAPNQAGDPVNGRLQAGLLHFSTYSVRTGKAGW